MEVQGIAGQVGRFGQDKAWQDRERQCMVKILFHVTSCFFFFLVDLCNSPFECSETLQNIQSMQRFIVFKKASGKIKATTAFLRVIIMAT